MGHLSDPRKIGKILARVAEDNMYASPKTIRVSLDMLGQLSEACGEGDEGARMAMLLLAGVRDNKLDQEQQKLEAALLSEGKGTS